MAVSIEPHIRFVRVEAPTRFRSLDVVRVERISPHMTRVTLGGPEIASFTSVGWDDDIRMQLPLDFSQVPLPPVIETNPWRMVFPDGAPATESRAYTIRKLDHDVGEMVLDMVLHGEGLATRWAEQARPGHVVTVAGPWGS
ncbi:MAG TPA: siderophore-interacting protein, partial [Thermomicrobiales bacterium]|nr:siderophore-interacting protein [Thermomicrobiales bacterium]